MQFFDGRNYRINKVLLSCVGQWPYQTNRSSYAIIIIIVSLAGTQFIAKVRHDKCLIPTKYRKLNCSLMKRILCFNFSFTETKFFLDNYICVFYILFYFIFIYIKKHLNVVYSIFITLWFKRRYVVYSLLTISMCSSILFHHW